jgi:hypothetical protein
VATISDHGKLVANRAYGSADLERNVPLTFIGKLYDTKSWPVKVVVSSGVNVNAGALRQE